MKYFTIDELCRSAKASELHIDNTPSKQAVANMAALVGKILDPLRAAYGKPITVTSGYRCPRLNKEVGGVANSQHLTGLAADITVGSRQENKKLFDLIQELKLPFDQLIDEYHLRWVHVSFSQKPRGEVIYKR